MDKEISFIAKRYKPGRFNTDQAWKRLGISRPFAWTRIRAAAAIAGVVVLTATAAIIYHQRAAAPAIDAPSETLQQQDALNAVRVIDFENAPLSVVVANINDTYGVEIGNVPDNADEYALSLKYEGTADDLVSTINDILGTQMTVIR